MNLLSLLSPHFLKRTELGRTALTCIRHAIKSEKIEQRSVQQYLSCWTQQNARIARSFGAATTYMLTSLVSDANDFAITRTNEIALEILYDLKLSCKMSQAEILATCNALEAQQSEHTAHAKRQLHLLAHYQKRAKLGFRNAADQVAFLKRQSRYLQQNNREEQKAILECATKNQKQYRRFGYVGVRSHNHLDKIGGTRTFCRFIQKTISSFGKGHLHRVQKLRYASEEKMQLLGLLQKIIRKAPFGQAVRLTFRFENDAYPKTITLIPSETTLFDAECGELNTSTRSEFAKTFKHTYFKDNSHKDTVSSYTLELFEAL